MTRIFLDANVLFSAAYRHDSAQGALIELAAAGLIETFSSAFAIEESRRNLQMKAASAMPGWQRMIAVVRVAAEPDREHLAWASTLVVSKDAPILGSAARAAADLLVTGDRKDFGHLFETRQRGVLILSPAAAVRLLLDSFGAPVAD